MNKVQKAWLKNREKRRAEQLQKILKIVEELNITGEQATITVKRGAYFKDEGMTAVAFADQPERIFNLLEIPTKTPPDPKAEGRQEDEG